jgi:hypothetical protein
MRNKACILLLLLIMPLRAGAYETAVHTKITVSAFRLASEHNGFLTRLAIAPTDTFGGPQRTPEFLAGAGTVGEDDDRRPLKHFLDPVHGVPLTQPVYVCLPIGERADSWAIDGFRSGWSIADAKQRLSQAVLGGNAAIRAEAFRQFFLTLGHIVHLVQDMAQPEHTRNDQHRFGNTMPNGECTPGSLYEAWTLRYLSESFPADSLPDRQNYFVGTEPTRLPSYAAYFSGNGKGMADFANANFVTQDTNYNDEAESFLSGRCVTFTKPSLQNAERRIEVVPETVVNDPCCGTPTIVSIPEYVYSAPAYDAYKDLAPIDRYHTHLSAIDHEIQQITQSDPIAGGEGVFSLSSHSYQSRAAILLPRAVEYSAGLIDHLLRGQMLLTWQEAGGGAWNIAVTNHSAERIGADARLTIVYKADPAYFHSADGSDTGLVFDDVLAGWIPGFAGIAPGETVVLQNILPAGLQPGDVLTDHERRSILTASLGDEPGAVIPLVQAPVGMEVQLETAPDLVRMYAYCVGSRPFTFRQMPPDFATRPPVHNIKFLIAPTEECRVILQSLEVPRVGFEGSPVAVHLRVLRDGQVIEDLHTTMDAGDGAVDGCHYFARDGHCDRNITRLGHCTGTPPFVSCPTVYEPWDLTGPYARTVGQ